MRAGVTPVSEATGTQEIAQSVAAGVVLHDGWSASVHRGAPHTVHRVRAGETLRSIAERWDVNAADLWAYNVNPAVRPASTAVGLATRGPELLYPGDQLLIPQDPAHVPHTVTIYDGQGTKLYEITVKEA